jgi:hypothetical protein
MSTLQIWELMSGALHLVRRRIRRGKGGIYSAFKYIWRHMCYLYTVVSRLVRKHTQTNTVKDFSRSGRPHVTSQCEDRALHRLVRRMPFANSPVLKKTKVTKWTARNRVKSVGLKSKALVKRTILSDRHQRLRLSKCIVRRLFNLRTLCMLHWSDENRFLLHVTDGRMRVWRQK